MRVVKRYRLVRALARRWWRVRRTPVGFPVLSEFDLLAQGFYVDAPSHVEVVTAAFRGTAKSFALLPVSMVADIVASQIAQDNVHLLILFDAAEMSFAEEDFDRLSNLTISEFTLVVKAWASAGLGENR